MTNSDIVDIAEKYNATITQANADAGMYNHLRFVKHCIKNNEAAIVLEGGTADCADKEHSGGIIVFPTEVDALDVSRDAFVDKTKRQLHSWENKLSPNKCIDAAAKRRNQFAWTTGNYFTGRYTGKNGKTYSGESSSVEITGTDKNTLVEIATDLCTMLGQESVLLKCYADDSLYFINNNH